MSRRPFIVLADDLTGAAEIAAIAHQAGLRAVVLTTPPAGALAADVIVCDTNTRLLSPGVAARRVSALATMLNRRPNAGFFKKTDSVLRGNVLAELRAATGALRLRRSLLVPCNPSLGRTIEHGTYFIAGTPLHRTSFARDPHHPRRTSNVLKLLGGGKLPDGVACCRPADRVPLDGVVVGEARSPADAALWSAQLDRQILPAGGADFFRAWLAQKSVNRAAPVQRPIATDAVLLLSGTATPTDPVSPLPGAVLQVKARAVPSPAALSAQAAARLRSEGFAAIVMHGRLVRSPRTPKSLNRLFASVARRLRDAGNFTHLIIAGGATAASVLAALEWTRLEVVHVWGPGVVTLRPAGATRCVVTLKPGSYAWPVSLLRHFTPPTAA